jgi:hypothetical protein
VWSLGDILGGRARRLALALTLAALGNAMLLAKIRETNSWIPAAGMVLVGFALGAISPSRAWLTSSAAFWVGVALSRFVAGIGTDSGDQLTFIALRVFELSGMFAAVVASALVGGWLRARSRERNACSTSSRWSRFR